MLGLSANTYSCGGEGSLGGGDGEEGTFSAVGFFETLEKNLRIPSFFSSFRSSISEGAEDSSDESSSDMVVALRCCAIGVAT